MAIEQTHHDITELEQSDDRMDRMPLVEGLAEKDINQADASFGKVCT